MHSTENSTGTPGDAMSRRSFMRAMPVAGAAMAMPLSVMAAAPELSPEERFAHHSAELIKAINEMPWVSNSRWFLALAGRPGKVSNIVDFSRFDLVEDPEIKGLMIERRVELMGR